MDAPSALATCLLLATSPLTPRVEAPPARVLVVDLDDVGFDLLRDTPTPTLDWMESNGRFFTSFATAPLCSPTRAMFHTGAYGSHPSVRIGTTIHGDDRVALPTGPLVTLPSLVAASGLSTAKVGKWHLGPRNRPDHPRECGWQHYAGSPLNLGPQGSYFTFRKVIDGEEHMLVDRYITTDETDDGIRSVLAGINLVSVSYHAPHSPYHEPPPHLHTIAPLQSFRDQARAMLQACDTELGRLVRAALANDYTVLVYADNGTARVIGGLKGSVHDPAIITPCWVVGPGIAPGVDDSRVGAVDLYATIAELLGLAPTGPLQGPHSRSFVPALRGAPTYQRWTYSERFARNGVDPRDGASPWRRALRGERYKLIDRSSTGEALHDLWNDPTESVNLLGGAPLSPDAQAALTHFRRVLQRL